jgi:cold shock CspA family protein
MFDALIPGAEVEFNPKEAEKGKQAADVRTLIGAAK